MRTDYIERQFIRDSKRRRMDVVMAYFYSKYGKDNKTFNRWRLKYLEYVKERYTELYKRAIH